MTRRRGLVYGIMRTAAIPIWTMTPVTRRRFARGPPLADTGYERHGHPFGKRAGTLSQLTLRNVIILSERQRVTAAFMISIDAFIENKLVYCLY